MSDTELDDTVAATGPNHADDSGSIKTAHGADDVDRWERRHSRNTIVLTAVAAASAIGSVIFSGLQWYEVHEGGAQVAKQIAIAETQSKAAALQAEALRNTSVATQNQVEIARGQAGTAKRALELQAASGDISRSLLKQVQTDARSKGRTIQLAFLKLPSGLVADARAQFTEVLNNIGSTPVEIDSYYTGIRLGSDDPARAYAAYLKELRGVRPQRRTIGPGMSLAPNFDMGLSFTKEMVAAFDQRTTRLIFMSYVPYRDASGIQHHAHACAYIEKDMPSMACPTPPDD